MLTVTVSPFANSVRPPGTCTATWPRAYVLSITSAAFTKTKPAPSTAARAASSVRPKSGGTSTFAAENASVMMSPELAVSPPTGDCVSTMAVSSHTVVAGLRATVNLAVSSVVFAVRQPTPCKLGTVTPPLPPMLNTKYNTAARITPPAATAAMM